MEEWQDILSRSITRVSELKTYFDVDTQKTRRVVNKYPMRINPYFIDLIQNRGDVIWKQCIPDIAEVEDPFGMKDPLSEEVDSPVVNLTHRYPDRVLLLVTDQCAIYCRFCTRKRKVGHKFVVTDDTIRAGIEYIRKTKKVKDVVLSGGDPLLLTDKKLEWILKSLKEIRHIDIIRIGTRIPCTLPQRVTKRLTKLLKKYHPLYINTHFNHPNELTKEAQIACEKFADAGIPLGNQTVLLRGINDDPDIIKDLFRKLLTFRVKPYYLFQSDFVRGANHFRTTIQEGLEIMRKLQGYISGLAVPHFAVDMPGGGGKIPLLPNYIVKINNREIIVRNYKGRIYRYPQITELAPVQEEPVTVTQQELFTEVETTVGAKK